MTFNPFPQGFVNRLGAKCASPWVDPLQFRGQMSSNSPEFSTANNVLGEPLKVCGCEPMTGWYRNGFCQTDPTISASTASAA